MSDSQREVAGTIGVPVARRHIFLCCDQTNPKCCEKDRGLAAWEFLKRRLKELGLSEQGGILRTKARSEEHTSELQSLRHLVCRLLLEKKKKKEKQTQNNKNIS